MRSSVRRLFFLLLVALIGCGGGAGSVSPRAPGGGASGGISVPKQYAVMDIGAGAFPEAINSNAMVVGEINGEAFAYTAGSVHMLGALPGSGNTSVATAVNDSGVIVGTTMFAGGDHREATLFSLTSPPQPLGTGDQSDSFATGANNAGEIAGTVTTAPNCFGRAAIFDGRGNVTTEFGQDAAATAVNNAGTILAQNFTPGTAPCEGFLQSFLYPSNTSVPYPANDSSPDSYSHYGFAALNNNGDAAGTYQDTTGATAIMYYHDGATIEILPPGLSNVSVNGMNDASWMVGSFNNRPPMDSGAFLYANGAAINLQSLLSPADAAAWQLLYAQSINNKGYVAAVASSASGMQHGVLLVPQP